MNWGWWIPIGLGIWLVVSVPVALLVGRWLWNASRARDRVQYPVSNVRVVGPPGHASPDPAADQTYPAQGDTNR